MKKFDKETLDDMFRATVILYNKVYNSYYSYGLDITSSQKAEEMLGKISALYSEIYEIYNDIVTVEYKHEIDLTRVKDEGVEQYYKHLTLLSYINLLNAECEQYTKLYHIHEEL